VDYRPLRSNCAINQVRATITHWTKTPFLVTDSKTGASQTLSYSDCMIKKSAVVGPQGLVDSGSSGKPECTDWDCVNR